MAKKRVRILLIEDDPGDVRLVREHLDGQPMDILPADSLEQGLALLSQSDIDLVMLDLNLPDAHGEDCLLPVLEARSNLPVIILTGYGDEDIASRAITLGAQDYLLKADISTSLLTRSIHYALERWTILEDLFRSRQWLKSILQANIDGMIVVDASNVIRFANDVAQKLVPDGIAVGSLLHLPLEEGNLLLGGKHIEMRFREFEWQNAPARLVILRDISERVHFEEERTRYGEKLEEEVRQRTNELSDALADAEQSRKHLDIIIRSMADGLLVTDKQGRVTLLNPTAQEIFPQEQAIMPGDHLATAIQNTDARRKLLEGLQQTATKGYSQFLMEVNDDNGRKHYRVKNVPLPEVQDGNQGTVTLLHDVSEEQEMDRLKSEFLSTAAHELRTPLTSVLGFSEILLTRDSLPQPVVKRYLEFIYAQSRKVTSILSDLLDLARIESGKGFELSINPCDLQAIIQDKVAAYSEQHPLCSFTVLASSSVQTVMADKAKLEQILENLLSNAVKYSPDGGSVDVLLDDLRVEQEEWLRVSISDQGMGMSQEQLGRIFDKFYRADASNTAIPGTGLGMSIVKLLVEAHGGNVEIASKRGEGTTVWITLPLRTEAHLEAPQEEPAQAAARDAGESLPPGP